MVGLLSAEVTDHPLRFRRHPHLPPLEEDTAEVLLLEEDTVVALRSAEDTAEVLP